MIMGGKLASSQLSSKKVKPHVIRLSFEKYISRSIRKSVRSCFVRHIDTKLINETPSHVKQNKSAKTNFQFSYFFRSRLGENQLLNCKIKLVYARDQLQEVYHLLG